MQTTINLGLKKPEANDTVNVDDLNYNADVLDQEVAARIKNAGGAPSVQAGLDAAKPAPGTAGRLYVATDTQIIYRDTGTAWQKVGIVKWNDIDGKPTSFIPSIHGNEAHDPDLALASDLAAHLADTAPHAPYVVKAGTDNKSTQEVKTLLLETDTRSVEVTRTSGLISSLAVKDPSDGSTVASVTVNRTGGQISSIATIVGARTITTTINRTGGLVTSITKAVS